MEKDDNLIPEEHTNQSSKSWTYAFAILIVILIIFNVFLGMTIMNLQNIFEEVEQDLIKKDSEIQDLQNQIEILDITNQSSFTPWPTIYDQIKDSVVLIQSDLGLGSGFIYDDQGHILTNYHVIQDAASIQVTFLDGNVSSADIIGTDLYSDIAIIKVDPQITELTPVILGNSIDLSVGEPVAAMGSPFGLSDTLTVGIVSSLERSLTAAENYVIIDIIQIDAAINPGNSGGPLVNLKGQVVGVNTAIQSETGTFAGIGFAIPSDTVKREVDDLITTSTYKHPWLGVSGLDIDLALADIIDLEEPYGVLIVDVIEGSPADIYGLRKSDESVVIDGLEYLIGGDVITKIDGLPVRRITDLVVYMERNTHPEETITLDIIRDGEKTSVNVLLGERPLP